MKKTVEAKATAIEAKATAIEAVSQVEATATATANSEKSDKRFTVNELLIYMQKEAVGHQCKVFTDNSFYVGVGKKCNGFSVNAKKTKYNIYCNTDNFELLKKEGIEGCTFTENGNSTDKTRPNYIECKSTEALKKLISLVLGQYQATVAVDNN